MRSESLVRSASGTLAVAFVLTLSQSPLMAENKVLAEIPIELARNPTVIPVTVGSSGPVRLVLDTGMPYDGILLYDTAKVDLTQFDHLVEVQIGGAIPTGPGRCHHRQ